MRPVERLDATPMRSPKPRAQQKPDNLAKDLGRVPLPPVLIYSVATTGGMLAALAVQIQLSRMGVELAGVWRDLFSAHALQFRSAGAWWLIAGSAFLSGALIAWALARFPPPWFGLRVVRWLIGAAIVFALAKIGHGAGTSMTRAPGAYVAATFAAQCVATLMAMFGAYFTVRR